MPNGIKGKRENKNSTEKCVSKCKNQFEVEVKKLRPEIG